jgi:hypothetical protein
MEKMYVIKELQGNKKELSSLELILNSTEKAVMIELDKAGKWCGSQLAKVWIPKRYVEIVVYSYHNGYEQVEVECVRAISRSWVNSKLREYYL